MASEGGTPFKKISDYIWEIPKTGGMRVPGRIFASEAMMRTIKTDKSTDQVANVAHLPGILKYSMAMPDIHWGYGFPIGGVAAMDLQEGVVSPGGVGYDINCGVRLVRTHLTRKDLIGHEKELVKALFHAIPTGVGSRGAIRKLNQGEMEQVAKKGARWAVENGFGEAEDLHFIEENGCLKGADSDLVSQRAYDRGRDQLGTLGSGNHFLEVGVVTEIYLPTVADAFGLFRDQIVIWIHTGSRGFGYQICEESLYDMRRAVQTYGIQLPDSQLACAPIQSPEGQKYMAQMACGANFAWANRQCIMALARGSFEQVFGRSWRELGMYLLYDVCHNIAKREKHALDGVEREVLMHRKGATRAYPPGHPLTPEPYRSVGQPVLVPGDMGRYSFVLVGTEKAMELTFGSSCHGAGRMMSRHAAMREAKGRPIIQELERRGIHIMATGRRTVVEEISEAYKDVADVAHVVDRVGISRKVAKAEPICVIKG
ncbi:MAG: RtcB family protein [Deltaproteobacteria bacterium]|nr:RtcB family protein [Deltaproteobacteria bacterium]